MPEQTPPVAVAIEIDDLPPSRKLIYVLLLGAEQEWVPRRTLVERARLDDRTVRECLQDLRDRDLVERRPMVEDPRRRCYRAIPS